MPMRPVLSGWLCLLCWPACNAAYVSSIGMLCWLAGYPGYASWLALLAMLALYAG
jgi:hypothetical protein